MMRIVLESLKKVLTMVQTSMTAAAPMILEPNAFTVDLEDDDALFASALGLDESVAEEDHQEDEDITCSCMDEHKLKECVLEGFPLSRICRKDVFDQVAE